MGDARAYLWAFLVLVLTAGSADALPDSDRAQVRVFASCAGRLSALMEFQWMFDGAASERTENVRSGFEALLEASLGRGVSGSEALNWRIEAKMAQARLLSLGTFGTDARVARQAARASALYLGECEGMLLG